MSRYIIGGKKGTTAADYSTADAFSKMNQDVEQSNKITSSPINSKTPKLYYANASNSNAEYKKTGSLSFLNIGDVVTSLNHTVNLVEPSAKGVFNLQASYYNRFNMAIPNEPLGIGFAHIYFVRPNLNILNDSCNELADQTSNDSFYKYVWNKNPNILKQLVCNANDNNDNDWMLYLSNKAENFTLSDEVLSTATYGKTWGGMSIAYGRTTTESRSSGDFSITYHDDKNFSMYLLHKAWVDYISNVYHGKWTPKLAYMKDRILDYTTCCFYILTAEDDETILFWSKYFGIFPSTTPVSHMGWQKGTAINTVDTSMTVTYQYAFKVDMDPYSLYELNLNSRTDSKTYTYQPIFDSDLGHAGTTWVGAPYVEVSDTSSNYKFILRHASKELA